MTGKDPPRSAASVPDEVCRCRRSYDTCEDCNMGEHGRGRSHLKGVLDMSERLFALWTPGRGVSWAEFGSLREALALTRKWEHLPWWRPVVALPGAERLLAWEGSRVRRARRRTAQCPRCDDNARTLVPETKTSPTGMIYTDCTHRRRQCGQPPADSASGVVQPSGSVRWFR